MKNNQFYVYVYLDQRKSGKWYYGDEVFDFQPFYVGKGTNNRDIQHLCPYMLSCKTHKSSTIKSIIKDTGQLPIHYRIYENISQQDATDIEIDIIKQFGRRDLGTGILCNHTDGGDGSHNLSPYSRRRISALHKKKIYQYSLDGAFIRKWKSLMDVEEEMMINTSNIPETVRRNGTSNGYIWSYKYLGKKIDGRIRYQMPMKYTNIKQVSLDTGAVIRVYPSIASILKEFSVSYQSRNYILGCLSGKLKSAMGYYWTTDENFVIPPKRSARAVIQSKDDVLIGDYKSMTDASKKTGVSYNGIWECCDGRRKCVGGYVWKYKV